MGLEELSSCDRSIQPLQAFCEFGGLILIVSHSLAIFLDNFLRGSIDKACIGELSFDGLYFTPDSLQFLRESVTLGVDVDQTREGHFKRKSASHGVPCSSISTFDGFTSRCSTPWV